MNIVVKEELRAYIDPLTPEEHDALERSLLAEGCRDALVLWGDVLVDGHNRYGICQKHGIPFQTIQHPRFQSMDDVHLWMIEQHLGRRSVSDFQRGVLALRKKEILAAKAQALMPGKAMQADATDPAVGTDPAGNPEGAGASQQAPWDGEGAASASASPEVAKVLTEVKVLGSREGLAKMARISSATVSQIEKIQKDAAPELVAAVKAGEISITAAAAVASLPIEQQVAAAAGGKKELKQAARQVREAKAQARAAIAAQMGASEEGDASTGAAGADDASLSSEQLMAELRTLRRRVADLEAENATLKGRLAELSPV
ncbi:MAG: plasmid replication/partition related protein [Aquabacterium sp.]